MSPLLALPESGIQDGDPGHEYHHERVHTYINDLWIDIRDPEVGGIGSGAVNEQAALQFCSDALPTRGGRVFLPYGKYRSDSGVEFNSTRDVSLIGVGGPTGGADAATMIVFTATGGASQLSAKSTFGFHMEDLAVEYTSATFVGSLVDVTGTTPDPTQQPTFDRVLFLGVVAAGQTAKLLNADKAIVMVATGCGWIGGGIGLYGKSADASFSNVVTVVGGQFANQDQSCMRNPGESWTMMGVTYEPLRNGQARACDHDAGVKAKSLAFFGGWMGDATDVTNDQAWIWFSGLGLLVHGVTAQGSFSGTFHVAVVQVDENNCDGISVGPGCTFGELRAIVDFGSTTNTAMNGSCKDYAVYANVATPVTGTVPPSFVWTSINTPIRIGPDLQLYRGLANTLFLKGALWCLRTNSTDNAFAATLVAAENFVRFQFDVAGRMQWGNGTLAPDCTLERSAVGTLMTNAAFMVGKGITSARPAAATVGEGAKWYDRTLHKPIWSDGTNWRDAAASVV